MATPDISKSIGAHLGEMRAKWGWFVALGVLFLLCGFIAAGNLLLATVASVVMVGVLMLIGGIAQIIHAFGFKEWGDFLWWLLSGVIYAVGGLIAFVNPLLASAVLTLLLAAALIAGGVLRIWVAMKARPEEGWGWVLAAGIVTVLAGLVMALGWPVNSLWILGIFLAIDLAMQGGSLIALGLALKRR